MPNRAFTTPKIRRLVLELLREEGFKELLGNVILDLIIDDYLIKSTGKRDSFGTRWKPTKSPNPIGIRTGALLESLSVETTPTGITVFIDPTSEAIEYAHFFDAIRPIFPDSFTLDTDTPGGTIPRHWREGISRAIAVYVRDRLPERMRKLGLKTRRAS